MTCRFEGSKVLGAKRFGSRSAALLCLLLAIACSDVKESPPNLPDAGPESLAQAGSAGTANNVDTAGASGSQGALSSCLVDCISQHPDGEEPFLAMETCVTGETTNQCADACQTGATSPTSSTCQLPYDLDPSPSCSNCLKDACCTRLTDCLTITDCLLIGVCAQGCVE